MKMYSKLLIAFLCIVLSLLMFNYINITALQFVAAALFSIGIIVIISSVKQMIKTHLREKSTR